MVLFLYTLSDFGFRGECSNVLGESLRVFGALTIQVIIINIGVFSCFVSWQKNSKFTFYILLVQ